MSEPPPTTHAPVYTILLHRPMLWGVPVKIVLWALMIAMVLVMLWLATAPTLLSKFVGVAVLALAAVGCFVGLRWSGQKDHDYLEVLVRFLSYPRYLGPR